MAVVHVIALITTAPGKRSEVLAHFKANIPAVHAESGCIEYVPVVDAEGIGPFQTKLGPDTFMVVEKWASPAALAAHATAPHMAAYAAKVKGMLVGRTIHVLSPAV
jgi:quinol monooxygenase YgiN